MRTFVHLALQTSLCDLKNLRSHIFRVNCAQIYASDTFPFVRQSVLGELSSYLATLTVFFVSAVALNILKLDVSFSCQILAPISTESI
jgi:hypothetical protein